MLSEGNWKNSSGQALKYICLKTPENNDMIGWLRKDNHIAPAARA